MRNEADEDRLCQLEEDLNIRKRMVVYMERQLKWTHRELHDALIVAGHSAPGNPSFANYLATLHAQYGDADNGFLPQCFESHTKSRIQEILRCLSRTGAKLGGKLADSKAVLAQRLAHWLNQVIEAGRSKPAASDGGEKEEGEAASADGDADLPVVPTKRGPEIAPHTCGVGEVPQGAVVTAEQAESALGRNLATELEADALEAIDQDQREEEEALAGRQLNPANVDYACLCWSPDSVGDGPEFVSPETMGWTSDLGSKRLGVEDFKCTASDIKSKLENGLAQMLEGFKHELHSA